MKTVKNLFDLTNKIVVVTGGAGFLGQKFIEAVTEMGGTAVALDVDQAQLEKISAVNIEPPGQVRSIRCDITQKKEVSAACDLISKEFGGIHVLVNNAAANPKVGSGTDLKGQLETFSLEQWDYEIGIGLTGALICTQVFGGKMAEAGSGVIINISSDLGLIAPNQTIYREGNAKPVTYSVVKHGIIGLTKYTATYWSDRGVRCNALAPGGVLQDQDAGFVARVSQLIPMGRMAQPDEYKAAIVFLASEASSYMTGATLVIDGGRSTW